MKQKVNGPFSSINDTTKSIYENYVSPKLDAMILSNQEQTLKFLEIFSSVLLLELKKKFPDLDHAFSLTYRIKSPKSDIDKLEDYLRRMEISGDTILLNDFTDLVGLRLIIEKIPHNISIPTDIPNYNTLIELRNERKKNLELSSEFHDFQDKLLEGSFSPIDYFQNSQKVIESILNTLTTEENPNYAIKLRDFYSNQRKTCMETIAFLDNWHNYTDYSPDLASSGIDFQQLLRDFDSRIDGKLSLSLYSNIIPVVFEESEYLKALGATISKDANRTKPKREKSGFIADFKGINFEGLPIKLELQLMSNNEYMESISGYSAHSNMPLKQSFPAELPRIYVDTRMELFHQIGETTHLSSNQLELLRTLTTVKTLKEQDTLFLYNLIETCDSSSIANGISLTKKQAQRLKRLCNISPTEEATLRDILEIRGSKEFTNTADYVSALHATARLDKDSFIQNRVEINYDSPYQKLAHFIDQQSQGPNVNPVKHRIADAYLTEVYQHQNTLFPIANQLPSSYVVESDISNYLEADYPAFKKFIQEKTYLKKDIPKIEKTPKEEDDQR